MKVIKESVRLDVTCTNSPVTNDLFGSIESGLSSNSIIATAISDVDKDVETTAVAPEVCPVINWPIASSPIDPAVGAVRIINLLVQLPPDARTIYLFGYTISGVSPSIILKNILCPSDVPFAL